MIRRLSYSDANIFLICFNVVDPESFVNVREKWLPELRQYGPERVPIILVGLQSDQRNVVDVKCRLSKKGKRPVKYEEGEMLAKKIGAKKYVECSSLTQVWLSRFSSRILSINPGINVTPNSDSLRAKST